METNESRAQYTDGIEFLTNNSKAPPNKALHLTAYSFGSATLRLLFRQPVSFIVRHINIKELSMAIYGIGAYYDKDVSGDFIANNVAGPGWSYNDAPELHQFINSIKVGDIVYIKSFSPASSDIVVKGIGVVIDDQLVQSNLVGAGRNIK